MHNCPCCEPTCQCCKPDALSIAITALNYIRPHIDNDEIHISKEEHEWLDKAMAGENTNTESANGCDCAEALKNYYTIKQIEDILKPDSDGKITNISNDYVTQSALQIALSNINKTDGSYATKKYVDDSLINYLKRSQLVAELNQAGYGAYLKDANVNGDTLTLIRQNNSSVIFTKTGYTLPNATANTLGGIKVGEGLNINDGVLSVIAKTPVTSTITSVSYNPTVLPEHDGAYPIGELVVNGEPTPIYGRDLIGSGDNTTIIQGEKIYSYPVVVYRKTATNNAPDKPTGGTFDLANKTLTTPPNPTDYWHLAPQPDWFKSGYIWASYNNYFSDGSNSGWTTPVRWFNIQDVLDEADKDWQSTIDAAVNGAITSFDSSVSDIRTSVDNLDRAQTLLQGGVDALGSKLGADITGMSERVGSLQNRITGIVYDINGLDTSIYDLNADFSKLRKEFSLLPGSAITAALLGIVKLYSWKYLSDNEISDVFEVNITDVELGDKTAKEYLDENYKDPEYFEKYAIAVENDGVVYLQYVCDALQVLSEVTRIDEELGNLNHAIEQIDADNIKLQVSQLNLTTGDLQTAVENIKADEIRQQVSSLRTDLTTETQRLDTAVNSIRANEIRQQVTSYVNGNAFQTSMLQLLSDKIRLAVNNGANGATFTMSLDGVSKKSSVNITADNIGINGDVVAQWVAAKGLNINGKTHINSDGSINVANGATVFNNDGSGYIAGGRIYWDEYGKIGGVELQTNTVTNNSTCIFGTVTTALRMLNDRNIKDYCVNTIENRHVVPVKCKGVQGSDVDGVVLDLAKTGLQFSLMHYSGTPINDLIPMPTVIDMPAYSIGVDEYHEASMNVRGLIVEGKDTLQQQLAYMAWCNGHIGQTLTIYVNHNHEDKIDKLFIRGAYGTDLYSGTADANMINENVSISDFLRDGDDYKLGYFMLTFKCDVIEASAGERRETQIGWKINSVTNVESFATVTATAHDALAQNTVTYPILEVNV